MYYRKVTRAMVVTAHLMYSNTVLTHFLLPFFNATRARIFWLVTVTSHNSTNISVGLLQQITICVLHTLNRIMPPHMQRKVITRRLDHH